MAKGQGYSRKLMALMLTVLLGSVALVACARTAPRLDLTTVPACPAEDGPGMTGPVPCVFSSAAHPDQLRTPEWAWVLYSNTCPRNTVQDYRTVHCVARADWTGGVEGEGRTN